MQKGSIFITVVVITAVIAITCMGIVGLTRYHTRKQYIRTRRMDAYYTAENAFLEGVQKLADEMFDPSTKEGTYHLNDEDNPLNMPYTIGNEVETCSMKIEQDPLGVQDNYQITATATILGETRSVQGLVRWHPPSLVFDYEYFLNNWGWWWGGSIRGYGDQRSNWDFDFKYNPYVYGHIFANGDIESNQSQVNPFGNDPPFRGFAGNDPLNYCHVGSPRVKMPNLMDLSYYESVCNGTLSQNGTTLVSGVHGDDESQSGIYLKGTSDDPIDLDGSVVIRGNCIIEGEFTGQGVLYVGGNLYVADNVEYNNGPDYSTAPETMGTDTRDEWVDNNMDKDLIGYAVRGTVLVGEVNSSGWKNRCYNPSPYGLRHIGDESNLGADGINGTPDDGVDYLDTDNDGSPDSAWYDADGDGIIDDNYSYSSDIYLSDSKLNDIMNYPTDEDGDLVNYNDVASGYQNKWEGLYYTNHAFALYTRSGPDRFNGGLICRDEAIIFSNSINFKYDSRIHSRYQRKYFEGDPNRIIDLGLPMSEDVRILDRYEIAPTAIN